jgi:hypothetical protein
MFSIEQVVAREVLPIGFDRFLLRIEEELEGVATCSGAAAFPRWPA